MKPYKLLLVCFFLFPFAGIAQNDSFGVVRLGGNLSLEVPFAGAGPGVAVKEGWGAGITTDIFLNRPIDLTLKFQYKDVPYSARQLVSNLHPGISISGLRDISSVSWKLYSIDAGLKLKLINQQTARVSLEAYAGLGWYSGLSGTSTTQFGDDYIYLKEVSQNRRDLALGAALIPEFYMGKGWLLAGGFTVYSFEHYNTYLSEHVKSQVNAGEPSKIEKLISDRAKFLLVGIQLSVSFIL